MKKKLPTLLGIFVLIFGVVAGVMLINSNQVFKIGANVEAIPKNIRFSNITDSGVTLTWTTDIPSKGFVKWGTSEGKINQVAQEDNDQEEKYVHSANIVGLSKGSDVFIMINSNGKDHDNESVSWQIKTLNSSPPSNSKNLIASGTIVEIDGETPSKALVYLTINGVTLSGITSDKGSYIIPVSNFISNLTDTTIVEMTVNNGKEQTAQSVIYPYALKSIPTILMGKTYDFRTLTESESNEVPKSSTSLPDLVEASSRFEIIKTQSEGTGSKSIEPFTLDSIKNGEIITTTDPEFFGTGPKNATLEVVVESDPQTAVVSTNAKGVWNWSPPDNLEPGEHKVTLKWTDINGIVRTITRSFIVSAAEGPAFESTPSATLAPLPTVVPTSTPLIVEEVIPTADPNETMAPTPETGSLTPTLGLFIMGIGVFMSSIFVYKKQDA